MIDTAFHDKIISDITIKGKSDGIIVLAQSRRALDI